MSPKQALSALSRILFAIAVSLILIHSAAAQSQFKVLYSFKGGADGGGVFAGVVMDKQGNLYGTTSGGGAYGYGTVFELTPTTHGPWSETVLHSFMLNDPDGSEPQTNLIFDGLGNLYGTTVFGGAYNGGTAFELTPGSGGCLFRCSTTSVRTQVMLVDRALPWSLTRSETSMARRTGVPWKRGRYLS